MSSAIDDLVLNATDDASPETLRQLRDAFVAELTNGQQGQEILAEHLSLLLDAWGEDVAASPGRARFCFHLAAILPHDSPRFRAALQQALRCLLPVGGVPNPIAASAVGLRDPRVSPDEIARRFECLEQLRPGVAVAVPEQSLWGMIAEIDSFTGEVRLQTGNRQIAFPLAGATGLFLPFKPVPELIEAIKAPESFCQPDGAAWREVLRRTALVALDDEVIRRISFALLVPARFALAEFEAWWRSASNAAAASGSGTGPGRGGAATTDRHPATARSLDELHLLLVAFDRESSPEKRLTSDEAAAIARLLANAKPSVNTKSGKELAITIAILIRRLTPETVPVVVAPLRGRAPWWPLQPEELTEAPIWNSLSAPCIPTLLSATHALFDEAYCAALALRLPPKCWPAAIAEFGAKRLSEAILQASPPPAAAILWLWKNGGAKEGLPWSGRVVLKALTDASGARAAAARQLHGLMLNHADFQQAMLAASANDETAFLNDLQQADAFDSGEKQSLMVKLARISPRLQGLIEGGQGRAIMAARKATETASAAAASSTPLVTSIRSHRLRIQEFENLVNRLLPENTAAIARAREHGDLRENAEYKAAKEMQHQLNRRHHELRMDLTEVQAVDFSLVQVGNQVVTGCRATIVATAAGVPETYDLLGVWDGDPDRHRVACNTPLGQTLAGHQVGAAVTLPDGREARITAVAPLPPAMIHELNETS